eukprot:TRINITY_DN57710_c0_g1_i1.p1 TRINITY_DN57710_c0_g1~~TRINITY_DN57710_c0_g1_i1.p1  ORF type:complete len:270 (-),score=76.76 TRINITY_DN57710_c0_g1_i1:50-811(-)
MGKSKADNKAKVEAEEEQKKVEEKDGSGSDNDSDTDEFRVFLRCARIVDRALPGRCLSRSPEVGASSLPARTSMFKAFAPDDVSGQNQVKSSVQRTIKTKILEQYPRLENVIKDIWSKDANMVVAKCKDYITMVVVDKVPLFWQQRDGPWLPTLRLVHKYPSMMPIVRVDKGAIKFVLRGAAIMCPGLTSPGGRMEDCEEGACVQVTAEGTEHACAVGVLTMSTDDIKKVNKGVCIENIHFLGDGLWKLQELS